METTEMDKDSLSQKLAEYNFYNTIDLGDGIKTPGRPVGPKQREVMNFIYSMDLRGKRVIDLGCANGLFAIAAEKQGAEEILAVEHVQKYLDPLQEVIIPYLQSKIKPINANVLELNADTYGRFDLVIFAGLLYHLKYPFLALKLVRDITKDGGTVIVETGIIEDFNTRALLHCPSSANSPRKGSGGACSFFNEKALLETLEYFGIRVQKKVVPIRPEKRFFKKLYGLCCMSYKISNVVLHCERDSSIENLFLTKYYESRNPKQARVR